MVHLAPLTSGARARRPPHALHRPRVLRTEDLLARSTCLQGEKGVPQAGWPMAEVTNLKRQIVRGASAGDGPNHCADHHRREDRFLIELLGRVCSHLCEGTVARSSCILEVSSAFRFELCDGARRIPAILVAYRAHRARV